MSTFIARVELHPSDKEQAHSAVHDAMEAAGFSRIYRDANGRRFHLPNFEYCIGSTKTAENVRDLAAAATGRVTTHFMLFVTEAAAISFQGLVPLREKPMPVDPVLSVPAVAAVA